MYFIFIQHHSPSSVEILRTYLFAIYLIVCFKEITKIKCIWPLSVVLTCWKCWNVMNLLESELDIFQKFVTFKTGSTFLLKHTNWNWTIFKFTITKMHIRCVLFWGTLKSNSTSQRYRTYGNQVEGRGNEKTPSASSSRNRPLSSFLLAQMAR